MIVPSTTSNGDPAGFGQPQRILTLVLVVSFGGNRREKLFLLSISAGFLTSMDGNWLFDSIGNKSTLSGCA